MSKPKPTMIDDETPTCEACARCAPRYIDDDQPPNVSLKMGCFIICDNQCGGIHFVAKQ